MKKVVLFGVLALGMAFAAHAQRVSNHALGVRLGDDDGFGAEISYQLGLFGNNRLEFDLGLRNGNGYDAFKLAGLYQWVLPLEGSFHWYVGVGGGIGSVDYDNSGSDSFAFIAGDIGIEYDFNIPLLLSLDFRPEIGFNDFNDDLGFDIGLGIRYQF